MKKTQKDFSNYINASVNWLKLWAKSVYSFFRTHWIGTLIILIATLVFFWPTVIRISSYNPGGDSMFNAWTLARDQHCILRESCPSYANGNIFYPNSYSMVYSETQLSAGLLTLPLYFISQNPNLSNNVWTIVSFFLGGWFMYLLAKYISRDKKWSEFYSVLAGLVFAFGPIKIAEIDHLQNLSIFYLPLIIMLMLKYFDKSKRKYLIGLFVSCVLFFYASWYQMEFGLVAIALLLLFAYLFKMYRPKPILIVSAVIIVAGITTLPLAKDFVDFSKQSGATFGVSQQNLYSASLADFIIPYKGTLLGNLYYHIRHHAQVNSYSADGDSYVGITLYITAGILAVVSFMKRKKTKSWKQIYRLSLIFIIIAICGLIMALGPFLKLKSSYTYSTSVSSGSVQYVLAMPYLLVDLLVPQLSFIRAINRASVLVQFGLCCVLAIVPLAIANLKLKKLTEYLIAGALATALFVELAPLHTIYMSSNPYYYNMSIPKVYKLIHNDPSINDIVVLDPDYNYPGQNMTPPPFLNGVFEQVLWAGYDNKNTFNGYSGYFPPSYNSDMDKFNDFTSSDLPLMRSLGIHYILVDKLLSSSEPNLVGNISRAGLPMIYHDKRYDLFKITPANSPN